MSAGRVTAAIVAAGVVAASLTACSSSAHHAPPASSPAPSTSSSATAPSVPAPLLPGNSESASAVPWSKAQAGTEFSTLLNAFTSASGGSTITSTSTFADYIQYSQRIALACDPFLTGLRAGRWPANAQLTIVQFTRLQQTVCDVELARGQAGTLAQYKAVPPAPANADSDLLQLRLKIYQLLGI